MPTYILRLENVQAVNVKPEVLKFRNDEPLAMYSRNAVLSLGDTGPLPFLGMFFFDLVSLVFHSIPYAGT